jgi:hypothetical protein
MEPLKTFSVVHFLSDNSVEVVPSTWVSGDQSNCFWPKKTPKNFDTIRDDPGSIPQPSWVAHDVKVIKSYGKYYIYIYANITFLCVRRR